MNPRMLLKACLWGIVFYLALAVLVLEVANAATLRPDLMQKLPVSHPIYCADSDAEWFALGGAGAAAYTWVAPDLPLFRTMWYSPETCAALDHPKSKDFADGVETMYHEWFHAEYLTRDEGETECLALYILRYELRHQWGYTRNQAQKLYRRAFRDHITLGEMFPAYAGTCTYPQEDPTP